MKFAMKLLLKNTMMLQKKYKTMRSMNLMHYVALFLLTFIAIPAYAGTLSEKTHNTAFQLTLKSDSDTFVLKGESNFIATPSSYSIHMTEDEGRCVIHMLNFKTPPGPGTYDVEQTGEVRTAIICILENADPRERLASHSGTFTITELTSRYLTGHFEMILKGPISGKEFHLSGEVKSENTPTNLRFD